MRIICVLSMLVVVCSVHATIITTGAGSAVTSADRTATFDSLTTDFIDLNTYAEDGLNIFMDDGSHVGFDAFNDGTTTSFYYGFGGNTSYAAISASDSRTIRAVEFKLGEGKPLDPNTRVIWETFSSGTSTDSGLFLTTDGTIVGWVDPTGFDELWVAAWAVSNSPGLSSFGDMQAIAIDDLRVELTVIPEPTTLALTAPGLAGIGYTRRKTAH